uniref:Protein tyrosine phosphatase domain-containing protein 1-like n=1 Tax=Diabrotica virgifera virgifera TaxID=50390 RepID=A0A6P7GF31_DIAVI
MNQFAELKSPNSEIVRANYNKLSEHIRRLTPQGIQCSVFCGGVNCKYENPENWKPENLAIQGIYSHWITDDILAMARPSTIVIIQKNIIQQFQSLGIKSIINLQSPREHASCGQPLEASGFSYDPSIFMEQNRLGRTGVLIACYLVYSLRVSANDAIRYVRLKRPGSVQTRGQIICVRHFAHFILPKTITYFIKDLVGKDKHMNEFTLHRFLRRQKIVLHGYDERNFKLIPKIIHCLCERILKLCACWVDEFPPSNIPYTVDFLSAKIHGNLNRHASSYSISSISSSNSDQIFLSSDLVQSPTDDISSPSSPNPSEMGDVTDSFSELSTLDGDEMSEELLLENRCFQELETQKSFAQEQGDEDTVIQDISLVVNALICDPDSLTGATKKKIKEYQHQINSSQIGWARLRVETDINILGVLLFDWIESLKLPIIKMEDFENIVVHYKEPELCIQKLSLEECYLIEYLLKFLLKLQPVGKENQENMLKRLIGALSKHSVLINNEIVPSAKGFKKIGDGTLTCTYHLFQSLAEMIENHQSEKPDMYTNNEDKIFENSDVEDGFQ